MAILLLMAARFYSLSDISHESIRLHLRLLGSSIYEYHTKTGRWPARTENLAQTSLPTRSPYWRAMLDSGTDIIVWHDDLSPNPVENRDVILAYHNRGLLAWLGHQWVCWGDLRTEYIPSGELRSKLASPGKRAVGCEACTGFARTQMPDNTAVDLSRPTPAGKSPTCTGQMDMDKVFDPPPRWAWTSYSR
jgi:hypothetical protein